jgi:hypothetical protein
MPSNKRMVGPSEGILTDLRTNSKGKQERVNERSKNESNQKKCLLYIIIHALEILSIFFIS